MSFCAESRGRFDTIRLLVIHEGRGISRYPLELDQQRLRKVHSCREQELTHAPSRMEVSAGQSELTPFGLDL